MAIAITNKILNPYGGDVHSAIGDLAFDSSYPFGGELMAGSLFGISKPYLVKIHPKDGYTFEYDYTNGKVKAYAPAPPVVFEELVTVTANVGTLKYPAAYVMYVGSANASYKVIPGGLTPVSGTCALSTPVAGAKSTLTFLAGDSVTSCYVTYVTQAWKDVFDNLVHAKLTAGARVSGHASLSFTAGTPDVISLGEFACAIQNITWSDNGTYKPMKALYKGETAATTEATIDFTNTSPVATTISVLQTDTMDAATDSVYIDYIKKPTSGFLYDRFIEEDDLTPSTDVCTLSAGIGAVLSNALLYGSCGDFPGPTTVFANLIRSAGAVGTTATLIQPTSIMNAANTFTLGSDHADTAHLKPSYIAGDVSEIQGIVPLEIPDTTNLAGLIGVKVEIIGR